MVESFPDWSCDTKESEIGAMKLPSTMTRASHNGSTQTRVESVMEAYNGDSLGRFLITRDKETGDPLWINPNRAWKVWSKVFLIDPAILRSLK